MPVLHISQQLEHYPQIQKSHPQLDTVWEYFPPRANDLVLWKRCKLEMAYRTSPNAVIQTLEGKQSCWEEGSSKSNIAPSCSVAVSTLMLLFSCFMLFVYLYIKINWAYILGLPQQAKHQIKNYRWLVAVNIKGAQLHFKLQLIIIIIIMSFHFRLVLCYNFLYLCHISIWSLDLSSLKVLSHPSMSL